MHFQRSYYAGTLKLSAAKRLATRHDQHERRRDKILRRISRVARRASHVVRTLNTPYIVCE